MKKKVTEEKKLGALKKEIEELSKRWKRALADYQNLERRFQTEKLAYIQKANKDLLIKLLPAVEVFKKAAEHLKNDGLNLALKQFIQILNEEGLVPIETKDQMFNPSLMECVDVVKGDGEGKVAEEVSTGYKLKEEVIKVAKVKVYKKNIDQKIEDSVKREMLKGNYM